jgi:hypothetical protein
LWAVSVWVMATLLDEDVDFSILGPFPRRGKRRSGFLDYLRKKSASGAFRAGIRGGYNQGMKKLLVFSLLLLFSAPLFAEGHHHHHHGHHHSHAHHQ